MAVWCGVLQINVLSTKYFVFDLVAIFRFQFVHDWIHKRLPTAFDNMFQHKSSKHHNLRQNDDKVSLPFRRLTKWGTNTLRYQGAIIHNSLFDLNLHTRFFFISNSFISNSTQI